MEFYNRIVDYYDEIFPLSQSEVDFTKRYVSNLNYQNMLDIGCGTGAFAAAMASHFTFIHAFDYDHEMVARAKEKHKIPNVHYQQGNMLDIHPLYPQQKFDLITCFGNTLVHLPLPEVQTVLNQIQKMLAPKGLFLCQLLNYAHIFSNNIQTLPVIDTEILQFKRAYDLKSPLEINFQTQLTIKETKEEIKNSIPLFPILKEDLEWMLLQAGFERVIFFSNFLGESYHGSHLPLIFQAGLSLAR